MRETFTPLLQRTQDYCIDDSVSSTTNLTATSVFLTREINETVKDLFFLMKKYNLQPLPKTTTTVANQIFYHNPPGLTKAETVTCTSGNLVVPLKIVHSQEEWDKLHIFTLASTFPQYIFPRRDDFGIWPTPSVSGATITIAGNYIPVNIGASDVSTGTVTIANNSQTVTCSTAAFTASMVGMYFCLTDSTGVPNGNWYPISGYTSTTVITLESYFEESTVSGATYVIGESPNVPEELHEFIPYRAAAVYHQVRRRDNELGQQLLNYYYTGDFNNMNRRGNIRSGVIGYLQDLQMLGRGNSQVTETGGGQKFNRFRYDVWGTTLS